MPEDFTATWASVEICCDAGSLDNENMTNYCATGFYDGEVDCVSVLSLEAGTWAGGSSSSTPLQITTSSPLPDGIVEEQYPSTTLQASGGVPFSDGTYRWTFDYVFPGYAPSGLIFAPSGTISGIPTQANLDFGDVLPGYLLPYEITATVTDSVGNQDERQYSLSIADEPQIIQPKSLADRSTYAQQAITYTADAASLAFILFNPETEAACDLVPACLPGIESLFNTYTGLATEYWALAVDPADHNYKVIASPVYPKPLTFTAKQGFTVSEITAATALFSNLSKQLGLANAMITSINRAQGAAAAGNMTWEATQLNFARSYAMQLSTFVSNQSTLTSTFVTALQAGGFPSSQVTASNLSSFQGTLRSSGMPPQLPKPLSQELNQAGVDAVSIDLAAWMMAELPVESGAGTYPSNLASTNLSSSSTQLVATLEGFAAQKTKAAATCAINSSADQFSTGQAITFTALVSAPPEPATPTGTITFVDSANSDFVLGTETLVGGKASISAVLQGPPPRQWIAAEYSGDSNFLGCKSSYIPEDYSASE